MTATAMAERKATETAAAAQPARTGRKERSIKQRTVDAAKRYLVARGYNVRSTWESESQFGFVAQDDGAVAFIRLLSNGIGKDKLPDEPTMTREQFEQVAIKWLKTADKELVDVPVRFDELALTVLCADRALIRHTSTCLAWARTDTCKSHARYIHVTCHQPTSRPCRQIAGRF